MTDRVVEVRATNAHGATGYVKPEDGYIEWIVLGCTSEGVIVGKLLNPVRVNPMKDYK